MNNTVQGYSMINVNNIKDKESLLSKPVLDFMFEYIDDELTRKRYEFSLLERAEELKCKTEMQRLIRERKKQYALSHYCCVDGSEAMLTLNKNGDIANTLNNFESIIRNDKEFQGIKYNELSEQPEDADGSEWTDVKDSKAMSYVEKKYNIYSSEKFYTAIKIVFSENSYNPIKDIIESVQWDGVERIPTFLHKWMRCEDTPYTREVSRLIFSGGINRLYEPGCKFDEMAVLVGSQGSGKSTLTRWLAIKDEYFGEVDKFEGQEGIEKLEGKWIVEVSELLALTKAKEMESVKSYLSRLVDTYRKPYERRVTKHPRKVVFVATTNKQNFLIDKTGNRRMYPVYVYQTAAQLYSKEKECKADILQCWAEAKAKFDKGIMYPYADCSLLTTIKEKQADAMVDDYRVGLIKDYLKDKSKTCIIELWEMALNNSFKPKPKDSSEIADILNSLEGWKRTGKNIRFDHYGAQKGWVKLKNCD